MDAATFLDNFATIAEAPGGLQRLRDLVLELAVSGRTSSQAASDEPAARLLERIAADQLVTASNLTEPVSAGVEPWSLPDTWRWARLKEVADFAAGRTPPTKDASFWSEGGGHAWVSIGDMPDGSEVRTTKRKVTGKAVADIFGHDPDPPGTILMSFKLTIGKVARLAIPAFHNEAIISIATPFPVIGEYLFRTLPLLTKGGSSKAAIMGDTLNKTSLTNLLVPVPPLAEQERIVAKVDELMGLCDELEAHQERRQRATSRFRGSALHALTEAETPDDLRSAWGRVNANWPALTVSPGAIEPIRKTILHLAIRGRLGLAVAGAEETAEDLIAATKNHRGLVEQARSVRQPKQLSPINDVPKPFDLPTGWGWARFSEVGELARGKSQHRPRNDHSLYVNGDVPLIQTGDVARATGTIQTSSSAYNEKGLRQSRLWPAGTLCITIAANIADSALLGFDACFPDSVVGFVPFAPIPDARYFEYFMRTAQSNLEQFAPSTAQKNINLGILDELLIPLPPVEEMRRIVEHVEALMGLCDTLEHGLLSRDSAASRLAARSTNAIAG